MNRHVKTSPPSTIPHFFTYYPHTPSFFPQSELRIYAPALPNPIVATGFYAARQPGQLSQGADLPPPFEEQCVAADMVRHSVSPARGPPPASRTRGRFASHEALPSRSSQTPIGESLADYEPLVLWKGINSVERLCHLTHKNNPESYSRSERTQELERALGMSGRESLLPEFLNQNSTGEQLRQES